MIERKTKRYPTDLTDEEWQRIAPLLPRPAKRGRKRDWTVPEFVAGGKHNPLGARALYLGNTLYRIHGTNQPWTIGWSVSSGCIRLTNDNIIDLYNRVKIGTKVVVK